MEKKYKIIGWVMVVLLVLMGGCGSDSSSSGNGNDNGAQGNTFSFSLSMASDSLGLGGLDTSNSSNSGSYDEDTTLTAQATAVTGASFVGWYNQDSSGDQLSTDNPYTFDITSDTSLYARFQFDTSYDLNSESYNQTVLWSVTDASTDQNEGTRYNTIVASHNGYAYVVYIATDLRVKIAKVSLAGDSSVDAYLKDVSGDDYYALADGHHLFSIGVDKEGYIHIAGDMHNYPIFDSEDHMPANMQNGTVNYWRSDATEDITSFTWYGDSTTDQAPKGTGHTYMAFTYDFNGELYYYSRVADNTVAFGAYRAFLVSRYDTTTQTWTALGAENTEYQNLCTIWEDNGEDGGRYSKIHGWVSFDRNDRMHITAPILNWDMPKPPGQVHYVSDITYLASDDFGTTWQWASGTTVTAPVRVDSGTGYDTADIVFSKNEGLQYFSATGADRAGNPIVLAFDDSASTPTTHFIVWNEVTQSWVDVGDASVPNGNDTAFHVDKNGVITVVLDGTTLKRMWRPDSQTRDYNISGLRSMILDRKYLFETGNILAVPTRNSSYPDFSLIHIEITGRSYP